MVKKTCTRGGRLYIVLFYCVMFVYYVVECVVTVGVTDLKGGDNITMEDFAADVSRVLGGGANFGVASPTSEEHVLSRRRGW